MKKTLLIIAIISCALSVSAQDSLYIYKTDGTVDGKQTLAIDSITFSSKQDSFYIHHVDTIKKYVLTMVDSISFTNPTNTTDTGVVINGVRWATRNVATPGTFATSAENAGMLYLWNCKVGWPAIGDIGSITATDGSTTWDCDWNGGYANLSNTDTWTAANDPSPAGWRVPTYAEIKTLVNTSKVTSVWTTQNGVNGEKFIDKTTGNSIFFPASGYRFFFTGVLDGVGSSAAYWSTNADNTGAYGLNINSPGADWGHFNTSAFLSVRSVSK